MCVTEPTQSEVTCLLTPGEPHTFLPLSPFLNSASTLPVGPRGSIGRPSSIAQVLDYGLPANKLSSPCPSILCTGYQRDFFV